MLAVAWLRSRDEGSPTIFYPEYTDFVEKPALRSIQDKFRPLEV
jgi:hypothetical protein